MPFRDELKAIHETIRQALIELAWDVKRADEVSYPRLVTSLILKEILTSDLVVADLTGYNPNVFYEVGLAHAVGNDLLMIMPQEQELPFDIKNEKMILYKSDNQGLQGLKQKLKQLAGSGLV